MASLDSAAKPLRLTDFAVRTAVVLALLVALTLIWYTAEVLLLVFAGVVLSILLDFVAHKLSAAIGIGRGWAFAAVVVAICVLLALAGWFALPRVADQISQLIRTLPKGVQHFQQYLGKRQWGRTALKYLPDVLASSNLTSRLTMVLEKAVYGLAGIAMVAILGLYIGANPGVYHRAVLKMFPAGHREAARAVLAEVAYTLRWWVLGQLIPMTMLGIATTVGLYLLDIPLAFTLGLLTGFLIFIPYIGSIIAFFITLLVAVMQGSAAVVSVSILFLAIHAAEGYLLTPLVQKRAVYLSPALTITSQVLLGLLIGFLGLALATPLTAAAVVLVKMLYLHERPEHHT